MKIPDWFSTELEYIDPRYYAVWNDEFGYFEIKCKMDFERKVEITGRENRLKVRMKNPTIGVYWHLNDTALLELRRRKYLALKFSRAHRDDAYINHVLSQWKEAKGKREQMGIEMMSEGYLKIHQRERSKTFDMGGSI